MASFGLYKSLILYVTLLSFITNTAYGIDIFLEWNVALDNTINPASVEQPLITINGMFPGPLINTTTNDFVHVNVFNNLDEPLLFTWNGIQQRLNSWQDGVSGTNCPIQPGTNWTYVFQTKDQIGTFMYFPSIKFQKAAGGYGPIRVNNREVIAVPFPKPENEFDVLIGDWFTTDYKIARKWVKNGSYGDTPDAVLMNGKSSYKAGMTTGYESFTVTKGKTYRFRVSNVGNALSYNLKFQNHQMVLVETEGSYTNQITLDSLDIHVGQSYSVLVTADQEDAGYYIVATPKFFNATNKTDLVAVGVLHYDKFVITANGPLPVAVDPFDISWSINQAISITWNLTTGAARPNPQGSFNITNAILSQTFSLQGSEEEINGEPRSAVNKVSYLTPDTPLKLADFTNNGSGLYELNRFSTHSVNDVAAYGVSVVSGVHKGWLEIVFVNGLSVIDTWHVDGFGLHVVGYGIGSWTPGSRNTYNLVDPVVRSTVQVYPSGWTAVYVFLDNPGMWNVRSQYLKHWYLGQELYVRVFDSDPNPAKERPPPSNILFCGEFTAIAPASAPDSAPDGAPASAPDSEPDSAPASEPDSAPVSAPTP